jgi:anti-sigma B factor antagonist
LSVAPFESRLLVVVVCRVRRFALDPGERRNQSVKAMVSTQGAIEMVYEEKTRPELELLQPRSGAVVVVLQGEHDLANADRLHHTLSSLLDTHRVVVVDVSRALFIDSSTLAVLMRAGRKARDAGKQFRLQLGTEPIVKRVLEISGLLEELEWYPTRDEAIDPTPEKQPDRLL